MTELMQDTIAMSEPKELPKQLVSYHAQTGKNENAVKQQLGHCKRR